MICNSILCVLDENNYFSTKEAKCCTCFEKDLPKKVFLLSFSGVRRILRNRAERMVVCAVCLPLRVVEALGIQSKKAPSSDIFGPQHLVVDGLLNFGHNAPFSGRFDKLANPVDARD